MRLISLPDEGRQKRGGRSERGREKERERRGETRRRRRRRRRRGFLFHSCLFSVFSLSLSRLSLSSSHPDRRWEPTPLHSGQGSPRILRPRSRHGKRPLRGNEKETEEEEEERARADRRHLPRRRRRFLIASETPSCSRRSSPWPPRPARGTWALPV